MSMNVGPFSVAQWHVNVGIVWTGPTTFTYDWRQGGWGPDCYLTSVPGFFGGWDGGGWCGVNNPQIAWTAMPGSNFYVAAIGNPFYHRWAWMRYYAYSNGSESSPWGGWS
jgi:hypothetical protein